MGQAQRYRFHTIDAETPAQALALARKLWNDSPEAVEWCGYDERQALTDIIIQDEDDAVVAEWKDPDELLRLAASEMLEALEAQAMADADPEASRRKGYYERARELRHAALALAGRPVW